MTLTDVLIELEFYKYANEDWGDYANCKGLDFISSQPGDIDAKRGQICMVCPVLDLCTKWADRLKVSGVFAAGEWRP